MQMLAWPFGKKGHTEKVSVVSQQQKSAPGQATRFF
jgi:hypothetical protein